MLIRCPFSIEHQGDSSKHQEDAFTPCGQVPEERGDQGRVCAVQTLQRRCGPMCSGS